MARFTEPIKWSDRWFSDLSPTNKLIFLYLTDRCDNAGFFEINKRIDSFTIGIPEKEFEEGLKLLDKSYVSSKDNTRIWLKNFIKHQKNFPLNQENNAHKQIISIIISNHKYFEYDFSYLGANEGLISPPVRYGNSKGNSKGNSNTEEDSTKEEEVKGKKNPILINEKSIIGEMKNVWMKYNPTYQIEEKNDLPSLLNIAYKIAKAKGWEKYEVVNGKLDETIASWDKVAKFIEADRFYTQLELSGIDKKWTGLYQTMEAAKKTKSTKKPDTGFTEVPKNYNEMKKW